MTEANYSTGDYYHYTYDSVGNRLTEESKVEGLLSAGDYVYDEANRLISVDGVSYTWDNNGNLIYDGANTYTYDSANRLISVNGTTSYSYNGLGDRLTQNNVHYTLDLNSGLTQVLDDGENSYLYGNGRISQTDTSTEYFLGDALGSVRQLTNEEAEITLTKAYEPYGEEAWSYGEGQSAFAFTGEASDASGLTYLRARYYNPANGRFITKDPSRAEYNVYLYAKSNPINRIDPSGFYSQKQISQMFHASKYMDAVEKFRNHIYLSDRMGFLEVLHRADNRDRIEFYTFSLNGTCRDYNPWRSPQPEISAPFLQIGHLRHTISSVVKGRLFWTGSYLWLMNDSGISTPLWDDVFHADYVILQNEFGAKKFETFLETPYPAYRFIWDEVDWPLFWKSTAGITAAVLVTLGVVMSSEVLLAIGLTIGAVLVIIEVVEIMLELIPIAQQIVSGKEPSYEKMQKLAEAIRYVSEESFEDATEGLVEAQTRLTVQIPIFDIRDMYLNMKNAVVYTP